MDAIKVFRLLVVAEIILTGASTAMAFLPAEALPPEVGRWLSEDGSSPLLRWIADQGEGVIVSSVAASVAFVGAYFAALIGLLLLRQWARTLFVTVFVIGVVLYPLVGAAVTTPAAATIDYLLAATTGAILGLLFVGPVQERFAHA